jgi:hypothetical protein
MTTDNPRPEKPEIVKAPPPEDQAVCELCRVIWPADALQAGVCPDCLDSEE